MGGWRAWSTTLLGVVLVSCGSGPDPIEPTDAPRTYELDCGDMNRLECEVTATEFAADILEAHPGTGIVRISFSFGTIDAELSTGFHVSSHLEPPAAEPADPDHAGTPMEAENIAEAWLADVSADGGDRGWSLLHPLTQERLYGGSEDRYVADVESIDWREFDWELVRPAVWDGNYIVVVTLPRGTAPAEQLADGHLMQRILLDASEPQAAITVRIDFDGSRGLLGP